jgi:hypothetical protein
VGGGPEARCCHDVVGQGVQEADGFSAMVEFTAPVFWGFLFLVGVAVMWLRLFPKLAQRDRLE